MDTFFEQIVALKKNGKTVAAFVGIWFAALLLCFLAFMFSGYIGSIFILVIAGVIYCAFRLSGNLNIEYEYILTNGIFDIDKIVNKSSRKRLLSFNLSNVSYVGKFNSDTFSVNNINPKNVVFATDKNNDDVYFLIFEKSGDGAGYLVFSPNEKMKPAISKFLPKFIANGAFCD